MPLSYIGPQRGWTPFRGAKDKYHYSYQVVRNQDPSKTGSSAYACVKYTCVRLHNRARALMKMLPHPYSLNKRTLYALDLTPPYLNHTYTQYTSILTACVSNSQLFCARYAAISQAVSANRRKFCTLDI
jgi:hypothetical protein